MTPGDSFIPFDVRAVEIRGKGWAGQFMGPGIGVEYVRDGAGMVRLHGSERQAMDAAVSARDDALNRMTRERRDNRALGNKVFRVLGAGRARILVGARR